MNCGNNNNLLNEPPHDKTNKIICAPSEDSEQPGHPPSLTRVFAVCSTVAEDPVFLHADSEDSDQTGRMPRLIGVFAGRTDHFVSFVMRRLKYQMNPFNKKRLLGVKCNNWHVM